MIENMKEMLYLYGGCTLSFHRSHSFWLTLLYFWCSRFYMVHRELAKLSKTHLNPPTHDFKQKNYTLVRFGKAPIWKNEYILISAHHSDFQGMNAIFAFFATNLIRDIPTPIFTNLFAIIYVQKCPNMKFNSYRHRFASIWSNLHASFVIDQLLKHGTFL